MDAQEAGDGPRNSDYVDAHGPAASPEKEENPVRSLTPDSGAVEFLGSGGGLAESRAELNGTREAPFRVQARSRGSVPLMAAGGTLLVAGAVIGGDAGTLLMVGGAGVLAWGVYLHF